MNIVPRVTMILLLRESSAAQSGVEQCSRAVDHFVAPLQYIDNAVSKRKGVR